MALEAQLAPITDDEITARTERMRADRVASCWFSDRPRPPWLGVVPSARLAYHGDGRQLLIAEGLASFVNGGWGEVEDVTLTRFLGWVFTDKIVAHTPRTRLRYPLRDVSRVWTTRRSIRAEDTHLLEQERQQRIEEVRQRAEERRSAERHARALREAAAVERAARDTPQGAEWRKRTARRPEVGRAIMTLADKYGVTATVGWSTGDPRYVDGIPLVDADGVPVAIFDPVPHKVGKDAKPLLSGLLLLFSSEYRRRQFTRRLNTRRWQTDVTIGRPCGCPHPRLAARYGGVDHPAKPSDQAPPEAAHYRVTCRACGRHYEGPWQFDRPCACPDPRLAATYAGADYPAEPSDQAHPGATHYRVRCRTCGGRYEGPWRRIGTTAVARE
jgi:competence protein CoiA